MVFNGKRFGLALSGGGYRAAAFHLGVLRVLARNNVLHLVDVLSTVSGGSIVGAAYALAKNEPGFAYDSFEKIFIKKLKTSVISGVLQSVYFILPLLGVLLWVAAIVYTQYTQSPLYGWIILVVGLFLLYRIQFKLFPLSKIIESVYDRIFFHGKTLPSLPTEPLMAINSTNLDTGRQFTFSRLRMSDSTYDHPEPPKRPVLFTTKNFPVSRAVMASSCVPFAFTPVPIDSPFFMDPSQAKEVSPTLIDGGVYDNQGMHKLTFDSSSYACQIIITSDAGNKLGGANPYKNVISLLIRTMDLFMNRIKNFQIMDNLYGKNAKANPGRQICYISLGWDVTESIDRFIEDFKKGLINTTTLQMHGIAQIPSTPADASAMKASLITNTQYDTIILKHQTKEKTEMAQDVGTNLTALPDEQIEALINHAEIMAEIQIRLYCPGLLNSKIISLP